MDDLESQALEMMSGNEKESEQAAIKRLAVLSPIDYDRARKQEAEKLGISVSALDKAVNAAKRNEIDDSGFPNVEPWEYPVNPDELLSDISATVHRFIVCNKETADAVALWASMTWFMDVVQIAPLAIITAPEKRCGKTQLLTILGKLSYRPLSASSISPASLYRCIEAWNPTLLLDETDAFMKENEELRGVINSGHSRDNAYVIRTVGDDFTPKRFSTWGAKALSGIGNLSDTLMDRAIILELRRKLSHESVDRLRHVGPDLFLTLTRKLARFADDYREQVRQARPVLPDALNDRAQDNWEPLLAIAGCAGSEWLHRANQVALKLSASDKSTSISNELLADIQEIFETKRTNKISTADLINALTEDTEKRWATYNRGKPLSPKQLANKLKDYGIHSKNIRIGYETPKGYELEHFKDAFDRYLSPHSPISIRHTPQPNNRNDLSVAEDVADNLDKRHSSTNVADRINVAVTQKRNATLKPAPVLDCGGVADKTPPEKNVIRI
ncbi:MAG: DUF3631 domain-containing protein [Nitrosomonas sp.]|uniref:DUF3631 domain-containing protein n=1 Tax=Nitrosomonas sp. TaxID=42353 RepID=UPI0027370AA5|nr:DUF3631 domain-containing protein [Nitrosomonas sp.]MDP3280799.1 DUF3631 domain-containing protein [Nitrosomonas sp.]